MYFTVTANNIVLSHCWADVRKVTQKARQMAHNS